MMPSAGWNLDAEVSIISSVFSLSFVYLFYFKSSSFSCGTSACQNSMKFVFLYRKRRVFYTSDSAVCGGTPEGAINFINNLCLKGIAMLGEIHL